MNSKCDTHLPLTQTTRQHVFYQHYATTAVEHVAAPTTTSRLLVVTNRSCILRKLCRLTWYHGCVLSSRRLSAAASNISASSPSRASTTGTGTASLMQWSRCRPVKACILGSARSSRGAIVYIACFHESLVLLTR
jgi:hypothetical protein